MEFETLSLNQAFLILSGLLGLSGTVLFCKGVLELRKPDLLWLATSMYEAGKKIAIGMKAQQIDFGFGLGLIGLAFILQSISALNVFDQAYKFESLACGLGAIFSAFFIFSSVYLFFWIQCRKRKVEHFKNAIAAKLDK